MCRSTHRADSLNASFSPHNDKQAQDRAYRIGQTREVKIIRLVTRGSLDENMLELATAKLQLDAEVSGGAKEGGEEAGADGSSIKAERQMKKSLLSGLKKQFERETKPADGDAPKKEEAATDGAAPAAAPADAAAAVDAASEPKEGAEKPEAEEATA